VLQDTLDLIDAKTVHLNEPYPATARTIPIAGPVAF
jgi:hypothetical protein